MPRLRNRLTGEIVELPYEQGMGEVGTTGGDSVVNQDTSQALKQLLLMAALQDPKNVSKYSGISTLAESLNPQPTAEEKKEEKIQSDLDRRLSVLESLWFPYEDQLALPEADNIIARKTHKIRKQFEASPEYLAFSRYARTLGATLAKAAGDTGNIAWAEQAAQLQALADADVTKDEAELLFSNIREGLGVPKDAGYYKSLRKGETPKEGGVPISTKPIPLGTTPLYPTQEEPPQPQKKKTKEENGIPNLPFGLLGGLIGSFGGYPGTALGAAGGQTLENLQELSQGPLTQERLEDIQGAPQKSVGQLALQTAVPALSPFGTGNVGKSAGIATALRFLLSPFSSTRSLLGGIRKGTTYGKTLAAGGIPQAGAEYASTQTAGKPTLQKLVQRDVERFPAGKEIPLQEAVEEASRRGFRGYTLRGNPSKAITGGYLQQTERALRELIAQQSPGTELITRAMAPTYAAKNALQQLLKTLVIGGAGAGGALGAGYLIGQRGQ